VADNTL